MMKRLNIRHYRGLVVFIEMILISGWAIKEEDN